MNGVSLPVEFKLHNYRFENIAEKYYPIVKAALEKLGHTEWNSSPDDLSDGWSSWPEIHVYNHCHESELSTDTNNIILKPTGPTAKHFALDDIGYANSSSLAFKEPCELRKEYTNNSYDDKIKYLIECKANKWDDSIILKWEDKLRKNFPKDHILVICQQPKDETVHGFGFGNHWSKICHIVDKLKQYRFPVVVKLHPSMKGKSQQIKAWEEQGIRVIKGYVSIHDVLCKTRVAIVDNSTAGIECMMHQVPIISYGFPEYHWATKQLQSLTQLEDLIYDLKWHDADYAWKFINWYINDYLCTDIDSTVKRLKQLI